MIEKLEGKIAEIMGLSVVVGVTAKSNARSRQQSRGAYDDKAVKFDVYAHGLSFFFAECQDI